MSFQSWFLLRFQDATMLSLATSSVGMSIICDKAEEGRPPELGGDTPRRLGGLALGNGMETPVFEGNERAWSRTRISRVNHLRDRPPSVGSNMRTSW